MYRDDIPELWRLARMLNSLTKDKNSWVYVLASSGRMNSDILNSLAKPKPSPVNHLYGTNDVDMRDGFPTHFLFADIVVVADPIQTHLRHGTQQVVVHLAELMMDSNSCIGRHFERLDAGFTITDGVKLYVYQKVSQYEEKDMQELRDYYSSLYPDNDRLFADKIHL
jgi:hypothetical protein